MHLFGGSGVGICLVGALLEPLVLDVKCVFRPTEICVGREVVSLAPVYPLQLLGPKPPNFRTCELDSVVPCRFRSLAGSIFYLGAQDDVVHR